MLIGFHPIISIPQILKMCIFLGARLTLQLLFLHTRFIFWIKQPHPLTFSSSSLWVKLSCTQKTIFWLAAEIRKVVFKLGYDPRSWCTTTTTTAAVEAGQQNHIQLQIIWPKTRKQENLAILNLVNVHYYAVL